MGECTNPRLSSKQLGILKIVVLSLVIPIERCVYTDVLKCRIVEDNADCTA